MQRSRAKARIHLPFSFQFLIILCSMFLSPLAVAMATSRILVTGGNSGIGLALCKQLVKDRHCHVYVGARNPEKGAAAVEAIKEYASNEDATVELVVMDIADESSIREAAQQLKQAGIKLNALVNNAGQGFATGNSPQQTLDVNFMGTKRVVDHFMPLLENDGNSRIVNVGSGGGCGYVSDQELNRQKLMCDPEIEWETIEKLYEAGLESCKRNGYGLSKALVHSYTMWLAREHQQVLSYCLSPGFVKTAMTVGTTAKLTPEEGTKSLLHCLFEATPGQSGWFFGSDCQRSPLHQMRNPPAPPFDGSYPWEH